MTYNHYPNCDDNHDRVLGREYGYPECCITAYIQSVHDGIHPATKRGLLEGDLRPSGEQVSWVPCEYHKDNPPPNVKWKPL